MINNFKFCLQTNDEKLQYPIIEHHACNAYKITRNIINIFKILFTKYLYKRRQLKNFLICKYLKQSNMLMTMTFCTYDNILSHFKSI